MVRQSALIKYVAYHKDQIPHYGQGIWHHSVLLNTSSKSNAPGWGKVCYQISHYSPICVWGGSEEYHDW